MTVLDLFRLDGKTALVTGCSRGIGLAMAAALAEAGANIIGVSSTMAGSGSTVEQAVRAAGREFWGFTCDLSDREALYAFIAEAKSSCPAVDILVNNAGVMHRQPAVAHPDSEWDRVMAVNLDAPFILAREFGIDMVARGSGKIIFTASLLSFQGGITVPGYAAAKAGVVTLTRALSNEWASRGVQVNAIAPGYIATEMTEALQGNPDREPDILARIPANRWGVPDDFKGPTLFLASPASDFVTGEILVVDGGWMGR